MRTLSLFASILLVGTSFVAGLDDSSLTKHVDSLSLDFSFKPVKPAYWTGFPHHRRTPFALSPDGKSAYVAYLDGTETDVHVQKINPSTFSADGASVTIKGGKEAGGLVAHNDGFALLTNEALPSGTANAPSNATPVPVLYRFTNGQQTWRTFLGGPGVHESDGLSASPDLNGDLVYSASADLYGAYFVVTNYNGWAAGHFGDSIQYVTGSGELQTIAGASSSWGCSHNTGIAFENADQPPFASICAEDQGAIWLNTKTRSMSGVKISNEHVINGGSGEPMGGMSGSYSNLARFPDNRYIFAWVSRGAVNLTQNTWLGGTNTQAEPRTSNRNVAVATFGDKSTLDGPQAISVVGATSGDDQIDWVTTGSADRSNAHVATFDSSNALITWEEIANPTCNFDAMGCSGTFSGSFFQQVDSKGKKVGSALVATDTYVAGDLVTFPDGRICWPYVSGPWSLAARSDTTTTKKALSFACIGLTGSPAVPSASSSSASAPSSTVKTSVQVALSSSTIKQSSQSSTTGNPRRTTSATSVTSVIALPTLSSGLSQLPTSSSVPPVVANPDISLSGLSTETTSTSVSIPTSAPPLTSSTFATVVRPTTTQSSAVSTRSTRTHKGRPIATGGVPVATTTTANTKKTPVTDTIYPVITSTTPVGSTSATIPSVPAFSTSLPGGKRMICYPVEDE